jgi:hypothetical protein
MPKAEGAAKKAPAKKAVAKKAAEPAPESETLDLDDWFVEIDDVIDYLNVLLYGREGSGKTTNAARLANIVSNLPKGKGKVLIINAEGGLKKKPLLKRGVDTSKIVLWPDPKKHERVTHQSLDRIFRRIKADLIADPESWAGVVFDSATEIHQAILDSVQNKRVQAIKNRGADVDEDFVDISDYGTMSKLFRDVLRKFRDLPCHFVVTALERRDVDKDTGKPQYGPAVTPGLQADLLGYVDFVLMCKAEDEDGPFRALTRANSRYRAKDRFDVLPKIMVDPYLDRIVDYVTGNLEPDTDPEQERYKAKGKDVNKEEVDEEDDESESDED